MYLSIHPFLQSFILSLPHLSIHLLSINTYLHSYLPTYVYLYLSMYLSIYLPIHIYVAMCLTSSHLSMCVSIYPHLSNYASTYHVFIKLHIYHFHSHNYDIKSQLINIIFYKLGVAARQQHLTLQPRYTP